jgi:hypothetical protein
MDQLPPQSPLPAGWVKALEAGRADVAAGCVTEIDTEALCDEIEAEARALARQIAARSA